MPAKTVQEQDQRFFGIFKTLYDMDLPNTEVMDLYEGFYSRFYDEFTSAEQWDVDVFRSLANRIGGPVLDLGCGSGRISLPLAQNGWHVTGMDRSRHMLRLMRQKLARQPSEVRRRIRLDQQDITDFSASEAFALVILGATSICLLKTRQSRLDLFNHVRAHLRSAGRFAFDYVVPDQKALEAQNERVRIVSGGASGNKKFTLFGELYLPQEQAQLVNFYSEAVDREGCTRRFFGSTLKSVVEEGPLFEVLDASHLEIEEVREYELLNSLGNHTVKLVICRAADDKLTISGN